jgi:hypothetical protein
MRRLVLVLLLTSPVVSNLSNAEVLDDDKRPKKGYNYKKHYKKSRQKAFFTRLFNLDNCHGRLNVN